MNVRLTIAASLSMLLVAGAVSAAQPWLEDRRFGDGVGIRAGRFELHPGVSAEFGYDSNFFQRADTIDPAPVDAWRLRITPSLTLSTINERRARSENPGPPPLVNFTANTFLAYSELFGSAEVREQRSLDFGVGAKADIAPQRQFGADVYADFLRNAEPSNQPNTDQTFDRGQVRGGAGVSWRPGGGLFDWRLGYEAAYSYFEDKPYTANQNLQQSILTRGRWRILPRSAFLYDARYTFIRYTHDSAQQPDGDDVQARLGFSGLVTSRLAFLLMAGWNSTFYEQVPGKTTLAQNYDGYVGQAELKYFVMAGPNSDSAATGLSSIAVGFTRDASNSYLASFYARDRGYAAFEYFLGGVFVANLQGGVSRYSFPQIDALNAGFEQTHVDASVFGEYRLSDMVGLNATFMYDQSFKKGPNPDGVLVAPSTPTSPAFYDNLQYKRFQAYVGMRLFW